ncbi:PLP-dependent aminotransferase family protein [Amycolatopsis sp. CA-161197]|uniref:MocR-like pyridoxine biosynthesis transcription factor PdxR n=1 Tax=Amycolatopsis sp. CA-161197 TaxID=3239922 RepID=UPI003D8C00CB
MSDQGAAGSARVSGLDLHLIRCGGGARAGLMDAFREAIRSGRLLPGTRLPSSRALAADLGVGRNTVVRTYSELVNEGWLTARHGSGTEVSQRGAESVRARPRLRAAQALRRPVHDLRPGCPDLSSFPREEWVRAVKRAVGAAPLDAFGYSDTSGRVELREALARYLARARGLRTQADNIIVCSGAAEGLRLVAAALAASGVKAVAVEEFGLPAQRRTLEKAGLAAPAIPIDTDGADIAVLDGRPNVGAVLLTPSHQFPLGVALHPDRRAAVVEWARRRRSVIIEDDYDGEFRYDRAPVGALQGLDPEHVIFLGTASKSLAPGLRLGWLVVPDHLVDAVAGQKGETEETVGFVNQLAMADFIESGAYDRHIRAMRSQYGRRRHQLVEAVKQHSPASSVGGVPAGLHVLLEQAGRLTSADGRQAAWRRLAVEPLDLFRHPESRSVRDGLVAGFATPSPSAWSGALEALVRQLP